jgi:hypothetical protein
VAGNDSLQDLLPNPKNEQEYIKRVELLIQHSEQRVQLGETLQKRLLVDHVSQGWLGRLATVYQETDRLKHRPRPLPTSPCSATDDDIGLSLWHVMSYGKRNSPSDPMLAALYHSVFIAKYVGNFAKARAYALVVCRHHPYCWAHWRLLAGTLLGKARSITRRLKYGTSHFF